MLHKRAAHVSSEARRIGQECLLDDMHVWHVIQTFWIGKLHVWHVLVAHDPDIRSLAQVVTAAANKPLYTYASQPDFDGEPPHAAAGSSQPWQ
eukprot:365698-Chlamydomonas_euryale.AAC.11